MFSFLYTIVLTFLISFVFLILENVSEVIWQLIVGFIYIFLMNRDMEYFFIYLQYAFFWDSSVQIIVCFRALYIFFF